MRHQFERIIKTEWRVKYLELALLIFWIVSVMGLTAYLIKDANKVKEGIKKHVLESQELLDKAN